MRILIKAKPNAKKESVEKINDAEFIVAVKEPPIDGRANWAITSAIAEYFGVSPSRIGIVSGQTAKNKVLEIK